ncbi:MAG: thioredoxin domain-containing protein [Acidobacteriota bacterium]
MNIRAVLAMALAIAAIACGAQSPPQERVAKQSPLIAAGEDAGRAVAGAASRGATTGAPAGEPGASAGADVARHPPGAKPNRLIHESSPYLLLHAYNPVAWYPWGQEAIDKARAEDKPIFLSIGYSTCYWCHVMEREVFSNEEIASLMNQWFVSIKVDREERPDLDSIYITATQMMNGSAGWPNSLFVTPELEPFFAGTYFPPEDKNGLPGFPRVLRGVHQAWLERRQEVVAQADKIAGLLQTAIAARGEPAEAVAGAAAADATAQQLKNRYDADFGGFGSEPKFPSPGNLFLMWERAESGDSEARGMVLETLHKMGQGAIYDHLGGGFHRYTLDARWRTPHFEKMLYDNANLAELLVVTSRASGDAELERLGRGTLDFVLREMTLPGGGFKSAIDAETDGVEGAYYIWTKEELRSALDDEGFALLAPIFGFEGAPNFEGDHYTLYLTASLDEQARGLGISRRQLLARLQPDLDELRQVRSRRKFPLVDDKVLCDWNGMMIAAMARAGELLTEPRYLRAAEKAADFLTKELRGSDGTLLHAWRQGEARIPAFLDDYAFLIRGLLALDEATADGRWIATAEKLAEQMQQRLADPRGGYFSSVAKPDLLLQTRTVTDGAIPSGNAVAALDLLELAHRTSKSIYRERARVALEAFSPELEQYPLAVPTLALAVYRYQQGSAASLVAGRGPGPATPEGTEEIDALARRVVHAEARVSGAALADGWRPFEVKLEIDEGWHINANPASLDYLIPTTVEGPVRKLSYPLAQSLRFAFAADELAVYTGRAGIRGEASSAVRSIRLTYQACDDSRCLPPVTKTLSLSAGDRKN